MEEMTRRQLLKIAREGNKYTLRALAGQQVAPGELDVIHTLRKNPGITQAKLCQLLGLDKGACARWCAALEKKGYLTREKNPDDGRSQLLYPTAQAQALKDSKAQAESVFYRWLLEGLEEKDRQEFCRLLDILYHRCKEESRAGFPHLPAPGEEEQA